MFGQQIIFPKKTLNIQSNKKIKNVYRILTHMSNIQIILDVQETRKICPTVFQKKKHQ